VSETEGERGVGTTLESVHTAIHREWTEHGQNFIYGLSKVRLALH
jgi:hypothetical protein